MSISPQLHNPSIPIEESMHVSFREVKEESYRALRKAGLNWGQAQASGRIAGVMEALWGSGVGQILSDIKPRITSRKVSLKTTKSFIRLNTRGQSKVLGSLAAMAVLEANSLPIVVRGTPFGPELAAALWDMNSASHHSVIWAQNLKGTLTGYCLKPDGDLLELGQAELSGLFPQMNHHAWWVMKSTLELQGKVILSAGARDELLHAASQSGIAVNTKEWTQLKKKSTAFLVPE